MATPAIPSHPGPDHLITVKVTFDENTRRFKLPLKDLRAQVLPQKLRTLLGIPADVNVILERYSDSASSWINLDNDSITVYKQLHRAAKAKSKLRLKISIVDPSVPASTDTSVPAEPMSQNPPRYSYLETVLSAPIPAALGEAQTTSGQASGITGGLPKGLSVSSSQSKAPETSIEPHYRNFEMERDTLHFPVISHNSPSGTFCIDCNNCGRSIANDHYHCSICERGDYDLCPQCVKDGATCLGEGHWLIKRSVEGGIVTNSTTETIPPRQPQVQKSKPLFSQSASEASTKTVTPVTPLASVLRTDADIQGDEKPMCNGCCREADESTLVRCNDCEDFDLCLRCLLRNKHGHHPAHTFSLGSDRNFCLKNLILSRCLPGRQFKHAAICDGCEKNIVGIRHKCLSCPDWDYCPECVKTASQRHPGHRFAPLYEAIGEQPREYEVHYGIFCDGPLCQNKPAQSYITGVRYKCAVCDDVDFCANCEALPTHTHNRTHPLVKFKTPVRSVTVSTLDAPNNVTLGDQRIVENPPAETSEKVPIVEQAPVEVEAAKPETPQDPHEAGFQAYFLRDTIADGTKLPPNVSFLQTWTLYNPGPNSWPVGSDVRFVGGDAMFNVDSNHPSSVQYLHSAMESNKLDTQVKPGNTANFTVNLRTPHREGTAISYWRLKLPDGTPIGHRLWCDIQVQGDESPELSAQKPADVPKSEESEAPASHDNEINSSRMIFPQLEKESPETSTHESLATAQPAPTISTASEADVLEDVESLTLDETDSDAGFLTDEEYDVLDASDQEFLEAKQSMQ